MSGTYSRVKSWTSGEVLTAEDLNAEFDNIITNSDPDGIGDASANATEMRATTDPYPGGAASLATDLRGEIQRLRYIITQITGESYWYIDPDFAISDITATPEEMNNACDVSARVQELTASGAVASGVQSVELNHATVAIAATIAVSTNHEGLFIVKNTSASGTEAHTLTLTSGTFDGTNNVATLNAPGEALVVYIDSGGDGVIIENIGSVGLS